jgi:two-component system chemotaxis sensor kinase CheA
LEEILINSEESKAISSEDINEIFRIMHTVKGSSAMMMFDNISSLAHTLEDLFYFVREKKPSLLNYSLICDLVLVASDFIKLEISKIEGGKDADGNGGDIANKIKSYLSELSGKYEYKEEGLVRSEKLEEDKQLYYIKTNSSQDDIKQKKYSVKIFFEDGCQMENMRAYTIVHDLKDLCSEIHCIPENIEEDNSSSEYIIENGFTIYFSSSADINELKRIFEQELCVKSYELNTIDYLVSEAFEHLQQEEDIEALGLNTGRDISQDQPVSKETSSRNSKQSLISVNTKKLDKLMDLVGEIVITESMVTGNTDLKDLKLDNFSKAARQLRKLTDELQDTVMSMRMVPVAATFQKMHRIVRDMGKKLNKEVDLVLGGEDTEVDKNIIEHLSDPLMHIIRNAMDHGIEAEEERVLRGKNSKGRITLEAKEAGGDVVITVTDDGKGLDKTKILQKIKEKGLVSKDEHEYTDREIFSYILLPGFSTNDNVTEYSGRGVGMDVVKKNIEQVGGSLFIDSKVGAGTSIIIKIPLTLAIVDGMEVSVGKSIYTIPITSIEESFKPDEKDLIKNTEDSEMIMIRGNCYPVVRIHRLFNVETKIQDLCDGIMVMVEGDEQTVCLFVDRLIGEQQVVVKPLPSYLMKYAIKGSGIAGCTILGDGTISLILDTAGIVNRVI